MKLGTCQIQPETHGRIFQTVKSTHGFDQEECQIYMNWEMWVEFWRTEEEVNQNSCVGITRASQASGGV